jgi:hypothetical protein
MSLASNLRNTTSLSGIFGGHAASDLDHAGYTLDGAVKIDRSTSSAHIAGFGLSDENNPEGDDQSRQRKAGLEQAADVEERANNKSGRRRGRENTWGKVQSIYYNISDKGEYYTVWGHDRANPNNPYGPRKMSNAQLRKMLIKLILEDGCDEIYIYGSNYKVDMEAVGRARSMIMMELRNTLAAAGIKPSDITISPTLMKDPEPWAGPLRQLFGHSARVWLQDSQYQWMMKRRDWRENRILSGTTMDPADPAPN